MQHCMHPMVMVIPWVVVERLAPKCEWYKSVQYQLQAERQRQSVVQQDAHE
jgi:hypothetical protein